MKPMQSFPTNTRQPCARLWDDDQRPPPVPKSLRSRKKKLETDLQIQLSKLEDLRVQAAKERMPKS